MSVLKRYSISDQGVFEVYPGGKVAWIPFRKYCGCTCSAFPDKDRKRSVDLPVRVSVTEANQWLVELDPNLVNASNKEIVSDFVRLHPRIFGGKSKLKKLLYKPHPPPPRQMMNRES